MFGRKGGQEKGPLPFAKRGEGGQHNKGKIKKTAVGKLKKRQEKNRGAQRKKEVHVWINKLLPGEAKERKS